MRGLSDQTRKSSRAPMDGQPPAKRGIFSSIVQYILIILVVLVCSFVIRTFVISPYQIPSASMETTIMTGDYIFAEKLSYGLLNAPLQRDDIVTFADPQSPQVTLIKRVIAVGGDAVDLRDGRVYVNGELLDEPYTHGLPSDPLSNAPGVDISYPYIVPAGYVWVMGDNRTNSSDSRFFGPVRVSTVSGKAIMRYWPLDRIGLIEESHAEE